MAKYERQFRGDFKDVLAFCENTIMRGSFSASLEESSNIALKDTQVAVRIFERYSMLGKNRLSLTLTVVGAGEDIFLSAITSGGSQAVLFKINTFGEESFLNTLVPELDRYIGGQR